MVNLLCAFIIIAPLFQIFGSGGHYQPPNNYHSVRAALARCVRSIGYETIHRHSGSDDLVVELEDRDSDLYNPSTKMLVRLRSLRPWARDRNIYFRYWLFREEYESEELSEKRVKEYLTDYTKRLATSEMSSHMISKTIIRIGARRRGTTVYLMVTDGAYTYFDDKKRESILETVVKTNGT